VPGPAQPPPAFALLLRDGDGSLRIVVLQQPLSRCAELFVAIDVAEPPCEERLHGAGRERVRHAPRLEPQMQLPRKPIDAA
jgi:hypothetical protein